MTNGHIFIDTKAGSWHRKQVGRGTYRASAEKKERMESTRSAIINAAIIEFSDLGYENASMSLIAERAGTAKGTLYSYFGSKKELYATIARQILDELEQIIEDQLKECMSGREQVKVIGRTLYSFFRANGFYYRVFSFYNQNIKEIISNNPEFSRDRVAEFTIASIEEGKRDGSIHASVEPFRFLAFTASTIWGMLLYVHERGEETFKKIGLSEEEIVSYSFAAMERMLSE